MAPSDPRVPARHPTSHSSTCALQILDHYFGNVCELDLVFGFHKVYCLLDEFVIGGEIQETSKKAGWGQGLGVGLAESEGSQPQQPWCGRTTTVIWFLDRPDFCPDDAHCGATCCALS